MDCALLLLLLTETYNTKFIVITSFENGDLVLDALIFLLAHRNVVISNLKSTEFSRTSLSNRARVNENREEKREC